MAISFAPIFLALATPAVILALSSTNDPLLHIASTFVGIALAVEIVLLEAPAAAALLISRLRGFGVAFSLVSLSAGLFVLYRLRIAVPDPAGRRALGDWVRFSGVCLFFALLFGTAGLRSEVEDARAQMLANFLVAGGMVIFFLGFRYGYVLARRGSDGAPAQAQGREQAS